MMKRRSVLTHSASLLTLATLAPEVLAQGRKDTMVIGMQLEAPSLDPTAAAASAIGEVTLYNIFETLTKINPDGSVTPLLAESWEISPDLRTYTFRLRRNVKFHNGEPFNAKTVKFAFERAGAEKSTNKDKRTFASMESINAVDDHTVVIVNKELDPDFLFLMGQATAVIVEPKSADNNASQPVGTGPYRVGSWVKGSSITLNAWEGHRNTSAIRIKRATFRFISDPAAQGAALLSGDIDVFPRMATRPVAQFKGNSNFQVVLSGSRSKVVMPMNNKRKPLTDVRVRRAIAMAVDRNAVVQGAADGYGAPIGSYYTPGAFGYVDLTKVNAYDPDRARALLKEAGVTSPLDLTMTLPPVGYARQGGEVIAAELAKIGINVKQENVEWAQWLANTYGGAHNYDLTIINHVEPFDLNNFSKPDYYWGYHSAKFDELYNKYKNSPRAQDRQKLLGDIQRLVADDAALVYLYAPQLPSVAKKNVRGIWKEMPIYVNDLSTMSWA